MNSFYEIDSDELNKSEEDYEFDKRDEITKCIFDYEEKKKWKKKYNFNYQTKAKVALKNAVKIYISFFV